MSDLGRIEGVPGGLQRAAVVRIIEGGPAIVVATNDGSELPLGMRIDLTSEAFTTVRLSGEDPRGDLAIVQRRQLDPVSSPNGRRALVIDDERSNRAYYEAVFEQIGWVAITAADGAQGIATFEAESPTLTIVDIRLPDINGYHVVRRLRAVSPSPTTIVLMSSDPSMVDPLKASAAGADHALVAPLGISQLRALTQRPLHWSFPTSSQPLTVQRSLAYRLSFIGTPRLFDGSGWLQLSEGPVRYGLAALAATAPAPLPAAALDLAVDACRGTPSDPPRSAAVELFAWLQARGCGDLIMASGHGYRLAIQPESVDTLAFERGAARLLRADSSDGEFIEMAKTLLAGFQEEAYAATATPLVDGARARLLETRAALEEALAVRLILTGSATDALLLLRQLTAREPWREGAWALLMITLYRQGRQREAIDLYDQVRTLLITSVGVDPSPAVRQAHNLILTQDARLLDAQYLRSLP